MSLVRIRMENFGRVRNVGKGLCSVGAVVIHDDGDDDDNDDDNDIDDYVEGGSKYTLHEYTETCF